MDPRWQEAALLGLGFLCESEAVAAEAVRQVDPLVQRPRARSFRSLATIRIKQQLALAGRDLEPGEMRAANMRHVRLQASRAQRHLRSVTDDESVDDVPPSHAQDPRAGLANLADCDGDFTPSPSNEISPGAPLCWEPRALMARWPYRMRNRFDHLAKQIGQKALGPSGTTVTQDAINPETQYADLRHEPDPARQKERDRLGLLGQLATCPCLIEVYSQAPNADEFRACLTKHLAAWQQRVRKVRSESRRQDEPLPSEDPSTSFLWIIAAGAPTSLVTKLKLERSPRWPPGVYLFGDDILRVGIVVASELPRDRTSLLVQLMAAGPLLAPAIKDVAALPPDAYERAIVEPILLQFQHMLGQDSSQDPDEQEFIMAMLKSWEEGKAEARTETQANAVLTVLRVRGIAVPEAARERIVAEKDLEQLKRWLEKAVIASSIAEVIDAAR